MGTSCSKADNTVATATRRKQREEQLRVTPRCSDDEVEQSRPRSDLSGRQRPFVPAPSPRGCWPRGSGQQVKGPRRSGPSGLPLAPRGHSPTPVAKDRHGRVSPPRREVGAVRPVIVQGLGILGMEELQYRMDIENDERESLEELQYQQRALSELAARDRAIQSLRQWESRSRLSIEQQQTAAFDALYGWAQGVADDERLSYLVQKTLTRYRMPSPPRIRLESTPAVGNATSFSERTGVRTPHRRVTSANDEADRSPAIRSKDIRQSPLIFRSSHKVLSQEPESPRHTNAYNPPVTRREEPVHVSFGEGTFSPSRSSALPSPITARGRDSAAKAIEAAERGSRGNIEYQQTSHYASLGVGTSNEDKALREKIARQQQLIQDSILAIKPRRLAPAPPFAVHSRVRAEDGWSNAREASMQATRSRIIALTKGS